MRDFLRFVCRSALGSAIAGATLTASIVLCLFGPSWELLYLFHPIALVCFAVPGAMIGFVLWIVSTLTGAKLSAISRITIGSGVLPAIYFVIVLYAVGGHVDRIKFTELSFLTPLVLVLLWFGVIGGSAALASPSTRLFTKRLNSLIGSGLRYTRLLSAKRVSPTKDMHIQ
jgi:hypothetical protein